MTIPPLLKARQFHSRIFAVMGSLILLISRPTAWDHVVLHQLMIWIGYALVVVGAFGRIYCSAFIGGRKNDVVVREGPFSVVRNPLYVFSFIALVGIGFESRMLVILTLLVVAFAIYYPKVVAKEEAFLKHKFGDAYDTYMKEVPRWLPNLKLWPKMWKEPEQFDAKPRFIRRTAMDAAVFFLPLPCFLIISTLQSYHWLPIWLTLP